ncbi:MAG: ADP-dependent NAD(P)H-hydrate dehydratase [Phycisphaerae bacterium]
METVDLPGMTPRRAEAHKGDFGKVLVIAGSEGMIGAPAMVAIGTMRTGTGLCRIATVKDILSQVLTICPVATGYIINPRDIKALVELADLHDAVAIGPGLGMSANNKKIVLELLERHRGPMIVDADALNILASLEASEWPKRRDWSNVILTPHMGEFMRLMAAVAKRGGNIGMAVEKIPPVASSPRSLVDDDDPPSTADGVVLEIPKEPAPGNATEPAAEPIHNAGPDRSALAELLSRATGCIVVLKGHHTVIADGGRIGINETGNPAMATAGSGDVLTGVIASLVGQGFPCAQAARLGVHLHGLAGDLATQAIGPAGILAMDIAEFIPHAIRVHLGNRAPSQRPASAIFAH